MTCVSVVYYTGYGNTEIQARAVFEGVVSEGAEAHLFHVRDVESFWDVLDRSEAIVFGSPTYLGSVSAGFKTFMDATSSRWIAQRWKNKLAAGFTNSSELSGDKVSTLMQLVVFAAQHGMTWIPLAQLPGVGKEYTGDPAAVNRLGASLGAMAQSGRPDGPAQGDIKSAMMLGARVARLAANWQGEGTHHAITQA